MGGGGRGCRAGVEVAGVKGRGRGGGLGGGGVKSTIGVGHVGRCRVARIGVHNYYEPQRSLNTRTAYRFEEPCGVLAKAPAMSDRAAPARPLCWPACCSFPRP